MFVIIIIFLILLWKLLFKFFSYTKTINFIFFLFFANIWVSIASFKIIEIFFWTEIDFILENILYRIIFIFLFWLLFIIFLLFNKSSKKEKFIYTIYFFINILFIYIFWALMFHSNFNEGYIAYFYEFIFYLYYIIWLYNFHFILLWNKNFSFVNWFKKILYLFRDIVLIVWLYLWLTISFYFLNLFISYYNWEKINHYQINQIYTCEDNITIILNTSDNVIQAVNPYENFIDFTNNYAQDFKKFYKHNYQIYFYKEYENYLKNCISQNGNNYFDEYERIHWKIQMKINISE